MKPAPNARLILSVLSQATAIASVASDSARHRADAELAMAKLSCEQASLEVRADLVKALLVSLIDRRVDAVREVCESILNSYSEQEKHFLSYHAKLQEDHARAQTPFDRSMLAVNLLGATEALEGIREDKHRVFQAMVQAIVAIGGDVSGLQSFSRPVLEF